MLTHSRENFERVNETSSADKSDEIEFRVQTRERLELKQKRIK